MAAACGATGDIKNNLMKLLREVQRMKLGVEPDIQGLSLGAPSSLLPILHHSLMHYSLPLASWLSRHDYDLYAKNDLRFVEGVYKVLREVFHYHPRLTKEQFLTVGYAERKLLLVTDLLKSCQTKHHSLSETHSGRGRGKRNHVSISAKEAKSEVLTVQTTSGISSAWTEPPVAQVQEVQMAEHIPLSSPDHSPPPHPITPTRALELTPSPPHTPPPCLPSHSSPNSPRSQESHKPQPVVVRHDTPIAMREPALCEGVPERGKFPPGGPHEVKNSFSDPGEKILVGNLTSSSSEGDLDRGEQKLRPPGGPPVQNDEEEGECGSPSRSGGLVEVNERVKQLAGMVEKMSARLVLVETQLKMVASGAAQRRGGEETQLKMVASGAAQRRGGEENTHPAGTGGSVNLSQLAEGKEKERVQGSTVEMSALIKGDVRGINTVSKETTVSKATIVSTATESSNARKALRDISSSTNHSTHSILTKSTAVTAGTSTPHSKHPLTTHTLTPHSKHSLTTHTLTPHSKHPLTTHTLTPHSKHPLTASGRVGGSSRVLASQLARIRAEEEEPPLSPSLPHPLDVAHAPQVPLSSLTSSPSSPDDTRLLIASLRNRAQRTKDFLQKANSRP